MSTVMVTGGAKRIGLTICQFFAKNGYNIALHYNSSTELAQKAKTELEDKFPIECQIFQGNLTNPKDAKTCINSAISHFGQIDALINNASFFEESSFIDTTFESLIANFNVHYFSPFVLCQEFSKQPKLQNGLIVNIIDSNHPRIQTKHFAYLQAKKALLELTNHLAASLAPKIRTNAISPGFIIPEENTTITEAYTTHKLKQIPLKSQGSTADITKAIECLLNSTYINGQNLYVDGGSHLLTI